MREREEDFRRVCQGGMRALQRASFSNQCDVFPGTGFTQLTLELEIMHLGC